MSNTIKFSEFESKSFGMRMGRGEFTELDIEQMKASIIEQELDLVRIKVDVKNATWIHKLEELGFPWHYANTTINYSIKKEDILPPQLSDDEISFELYTGAQAEQLKDIILKGCSDDPLGFYKTPVLSELIGKQQELEQLIAYLSAFVPQKERDLLLMKHLDEYIGFCAIEYHNNIMSSPMAAIKPEYRKKGGFRHMLQRKHGEAIERNNKSIEIGARVDNLASQRAFEQFGMSKIGAGHVIHIMPFLSLMDNHKDNFTIQMGPSVLLTEQAIEGKMGAVINQNYSNALPLWSKTMRKGSLRADTEIQVKISLPSNQRLQLVVAQVWQAGELKEIIYKAFSMA